MRLDGLVNVSVDVVLGCPKVVFWGRCCLAILNTSELFYSVGN